MAHAMQQPERKQWSVLPTVAGSGNSRTDPAVSGIVAGMGHAGGEGLQGHARHEHDRNQPGRIEADTHGSTAPAGTWDRYEVLPYHDGRGGTVSRRSEPGAFPLAHGLPRSMGPGSTREQRMELTAAKRNRVGRLCGYGNAIVPQVAAAFIRACMEIIDLRPWRDAGYECWAVDPQHHASDGD